MCCITLPLEMWADIYLPRYGKHNMLKKGFHLSRACWTNGFIGIPSRVPWAWGSSIFEKINLISRDHYSQAASLGPMPLLQASQPRLPPPKQLLTANTTFESGHMNILTFWASWSLSVSTLLCVKSHSPSSRRQLSTCQLLDARGIPTTVSLTFHSITAPLRA